MASAAVESRRDQFLATVVTNSPICREHFRLVLSLPVFPVAAPGQFVQVACRDLDEPAEVVEIDCSPGRPIALSGDELLSPTAMLRRPFSLAGRRDLPEGGVELEIIHRVVGVGTDWLSRLRIGDRVGILGPLGNRFALPRADQTALLVGGGVGIPPMIYLASQLAGQRAVAFAGAVTRDLLALTLTDDARVEEFARHGVETIISTDDGSLGFGGYVTQALERWLDDAKMNPGDAVIYTCGPELMMKRVAAIAGGREIECQVAVERAMACGMGTCQSCCIKVRKPDPSKPPLPGSDWCYRLACTDGPVFHGRELLW